MFSTMELPTLARTGITMPTTSVSCFGGLSGWGGGGGGGGGCLFSTTSDFVTLFSILALSKDCCTIEDRM